MFRTPGSRARQPPAKRGTFIVDRITDQTPLPAGATSKIVWTRASVSDQGWFSLTTGRFTPQIAGTYVFTIQINVNYGTSGETGQALLFKNGAQFKAGLYLNTSTSAGAFNSSINTAVVLNGTTDFIEGYAYLPVGITTLNGNTGTFFNGFRIG